MYYPVFPYLEGGLAKPTYVLIRGSLVKLPSSDASWNPHRISWRDWRKNTQRSWKGTILKLNFSGEKRKYLQVFRTTVDEHQSFSHSGSFWALDQALAANLSIGAPKTQTRLHGGRFGALIKQKYLTFTMALGGLSQYSYQSSESIFPGVLLSPVKAVIAVSLSQFHLNIYA